ncbi:hypothetical protein OBBRIDRAFT_800912 [Obba rivulosa]|uniref:Uncharacterized protein n=1 Tax=Obba rivulosa TaxID=1052685 RepID=A0A8E2J587_9APHY|nr:hypothetical protein OBBRIDRAFT_800912 [Obba rivulosa]
MTPKATGEAAAQPKKTYPGKPSNTDGVQANPSGTLAFRLPLNVHQPQVAPVYNSEIGWEEKSALTAGAGQKKHADRGLMTAYSVNEECRDPRKPPSENVQTLSSQEAFASFPVLASGAVELSHIPVIRQFRRRFDHICSLIGIRSLTSEYLQPIDTSSTPLGSDAWNTYLSIVVNKS